MGSKDHELDKGHRWLRFSRSVGIVMLFVG
jgi:hypothetical protein